MTSIMIILMMIVRTIALLMSLILQFPHGTDWDEASHFVICKISTPGLRSLSPNTQLSPKHNIRPSSCYQSTVGRVGVSPPSSPSTLSPCSSASLTSSQGLHWYSHQYQQTVLIFSTESIASKNLHLVFTKSLAGTDDPLSQRDGGRKPIYLFCR